MTSKGKEQAFGRLQVEAYLLAFAEAYGLERFVQCRTRVTRVEPLAAVIASGIAHGATSPGDGMQTATNSAAPAANGSGPAAGRRWRVTHEPVADESQLSPVTVVAANGAANRSEAEDFEAVVVCNGHYSEPRLPPQSGLPGMSIHCDLDRVCSRDYIHHKAWLARHRALCLGVMLAHADHSGA